MTAESKKSSDAAGDLPALRQAIGQRLEALVARLPQVRNDAQELHRQVAPIEAARQHCEQFVKGQHQALAHLAADASRSAQAQADSIQHIRADLHRSVEFAAAFVAARAESFLQFETTAVAPAAQWAAVAKSRKLRSEEQIVKIREWLYLKRSRWLPEQTARRGTVSNTGEPAAEVSPPAASDDSTPSS
jgi:hypothetical protein